MNHDPIVEEVRAVRERLAAKFDFDFAELSPTREVARQRTLRGWFRFSLVLHPLNKVIKMQVLANR